MSKITCPCCCGRGEIEERAPVPLTALEFKIWDTVRRAPHGIGYKALTDRVYADREDGGPLWALTVVRTVMVRLNKKLAPLGCRIAGTSHDRYSVYKLQRLA